tara:strand:+ start:406 stop:690 length:285 start_codon:yes stop_codon:yes gene_type:complete
MEASMFEIEIDTSQYNLLALNDTLRMLVIQVVVQILFVLRNPEVELLSNIFIENTLFIVLGVMVYWLVFNHLIHFKIKGSKNEIKNHYQSIYSN